MTLILMILFLLSYASIVFWGMKYTNKKKYIFSLNDTTTLKGLFCILVMLVHIPPQYENGIQNIMGSFAYIGVTFFFMVSSYGLKYGVVHKKDYLCNFWRKRLPALLVPTMLCNLVTIAHDLLRSNSITIYSFLKINKWVKVLILFYFVFWGIYCISKKFIILQGLQDIIICSIILCFTLIDKLTPIKITSIWPAESLGFAYGIILSVFFQQYNDYIEKKWTIKIISLYVLGLSLGILYLKVKTIFFWGDWCLKVVLGIVLLLLILQLTKRIKIGNRVLNFLGNISYEVYLIHGAIFSLLMIHDNIKNSGIFIWISTLVTIIVSFIIERIGKLILKIINTKILNLEN